MILEQSNPSLAKRLEKHLGQDKNFNGVYTAVQKDFLEADLVAHNWEHIYRDALNAIVVGEAEGADMSIVMPAIVMHDIGFLYGGTGRTHAAIGAEKLPEYLGKINVSYSSEEVCHIANCIRTHKGSMHNEVPETLEAKVVADADLLEKFGPIGVYQTIRTWTEFQKGIEDLLGRLEMFRGLYLETETGKKLADRGRAFAIDFFEALEKAYASYR